MGEELVFVAAAVVGLAALAQVLSAKLAIPSIVGLLVMGLLAGPVTGLLDLSEGSGASLFPFVSLAVGVILFEGGLRLDLRELRGSPSAAVVRRLLTLGVAVTWVGGGVAAALVFGLDPGIAAVLGALLTVSGPTVVLPLVRFLGLEGDVERTLRWEGILVDPIGAALAVIVFEAVLAGERAPRLTEAAVQVLVTLAVGLVVGLVATAAVLLLLRIEQAGPGLDVLVVLAVVLGAFAAGDALRAEAGLLATTVLGMVLANQRLVSVERIVEFTENLGTLITSLLFIVLSARLERAELASAAVPALLFVAVLVVVVRPLGVFASTVGSDLPQSDRIVLAAMAPRGIVAAATASVFAQRLGEEGVAGTEQLVPVTFIVILATAVVYGLAARPFIQRVRQPSSAGATGGGGAEGTVQVR